MTQVFQVAGTQIALPNYARADLAYTVTLNVGTIGAGATFTYKAQGPALEVPIRLFYRFATSNAVANRAPYIEWDDPSGAPLAKASPAAVQAQSLTVDYTYSCESSTSYGPIGLVAIVAMPPVILVPGGSLFIGSNPLSAADQFTLVTLTKIHFPTGSNMLIEPVEPLFPTPMTL